MESIALKEGWNCAVYTGKAQKAFPDAFASIEGYLTIVYYWNNVSGLYEVVTTTKTMVPYGVYWIDVTQDCTWTYGPEETAPTSVQLYDGSGRWNFVPYLGSAQPAIDAFASIYSTVMLCYYFNNTTKLYELVTSTTVMVPFGAYAVRVLKNCVWPFVFKGTITEKVLEYDSSQVDIPASNIPQGKSIRVSILGRNDMTTTQYMAMRWVVKDPDGLEVDSYSPGEVWNYISPGGELGFRGNYFSVNKVGTYTIQAGLLMNPDKPIYVDIYDGTLCTVGAAVPEEAKFKDLTSTFSARFS